MSPPFTYRDPLHRVAHQTELRARSAQTPEPGNREAFWVVPMLLAQRLQSAGDFAAALDWYWLLYPYDVDHPVSIYDPINHRDGVRPRPDLPVELDATAEPVHARRPPPRAVHPGTLLAIIRCHVEYADAEFTRETDESVANARGLYLTALRLLTPSALRAAATRPTPASRRWRSRTWTSCVRGPPRNWPSSARAATSPASPRTQVAPAATTVTQATPYRFKVLLDRARQLTAQAIQMEAGYQAALEKYDDRSLRIFDALKAIDLSGAQVSLAVSRVQEATRRRGRRQAQKDKADTMAAAYGDLIDSPPTSTSRTCWTSTRTCATCGTASAVADAAIGIAAGRRQGEQPVRRRDQLRRLDRVPGQTSSRPPSRVA